jgi:hypothetical protein
MRPAIKDVTDSQGNSYALVETGVDYATFQRDNLIMSVTWKVTWWDRICWHVQRFWKAIIVGLNDFFWL